ncbi:MAG TPA: hypothetical protein VKB49_23505 [Candidatus Sulfotelmatobacter sp.]|nr:hypothetical protein [Candidatus Sulfotelmatobacter sp.]
MTFPAAVTLAASGGPTGSTITITPHTIAAGAATTNVSVVVQVPVASAVVRNPNLWLLGLGLPVMGMFALPFGMKGRRLSPKLVAFLMLITVASTGAIMGCGNGSTSPPPPHQPTNYTITVTATSGSVSHSTALTLTVQ